MSFKRQTNMPKKGVLQRRTSFLATLPFLILIQLPLLGGMTDEHEGTLPGSDTPPLGSQLPTSGTVFSGTIEPAPDLTLAVTASLWGKIFPEEGILPGVWVEKGQKLARTVLELDSVERLALNDRTVDVRNSLEAARERARTALDNYRRAMEIAEVQPEYEAEVERRKRIYNITLKSLEIVNQQNRRQGNVIKSRDPRIVVITAPISGYISQMNFVPGEINPFDTFRELFTLVDISAIWVRAEISEKDLGLFRDQADVVITTSAYPEETFSGRFQALGSQIDPVKRTVPIFYRVDNPDEKLKLGLPVRLRLK